jgi:hypothetical protein
MRKCSATMGRVDCCAEPTSRSVPPACFKRRALLKGTPLISLVLALKQGERVAWLAHTPPLRVKQVPRQKSENKSALYRTGRLPCQRRAWLRNTAFLSSRGRYNPYALLIFAPLIPQHALQRDPRILLSGPGEPVHATLKHHVVGKFDEVIAHCRLHASLCYVQAHLHALVVWAQAVCARPAHAGALRTRR